MKTSKLYIFLIGILLIACEPKKENVDQEEQESTIEKPTEKVETKPVLMFFGNSITAGYQLDPNDAFPALIKQKMDTLGYDYQVINAGLSGETSAGGLNRVDWVIQTIPDVFVLELGANDGLRGLDLAASKINLQGIIDKVLKANPNVELVIAGMEMPPNLGKTYTDQFRQIFKDLAKENGAILIPFLLADVAGVPELNLSDGIHPTSEGHLIIAKNIWQYLAPVLNKTSDL